MEAPQAPAGPYDVRGNLIRREGAATLAGIATGNEAD